MQLQKQPDGSEFCGGIIPPHTSSLHNQLYATPLAARHRKDKEMKKYYAKDLLYRLPDGQQVDMYGWVKARRKVTVQYQVFFRRQKT